MKANNREVLNELLPRGNIKKRLVGNYCISMFVFENVNV